MTPQPTSVATSDVIDRHLSAAQQALAKQQRLRTRLEDIATALDGSPLRDAALGAVDYYLFPLSRRLAAVLYATSLRDSDALALRIRDLATAVYQRDDRDYAFPHEPIRCEPWPTGERCGVCTNLAADGVYEATSALLHLFGDTAVDDLLQVA